MVCVAVLVTDAAPAGEPDNPSPAETRETASDGVDGVASLPATSLLSPASGSLSTSGAWDTLGSLGTGANRSDETTGPLLLPDVAEPDRTLRGNGDYPGSLAAGRPLSPGHSPGILNFFGDTVFDSPLLIELAGVKVDGSIPTVSTINVGTDPATTEFDQINVFDGTATLALTARFDVSLINGFDPVVGSFFDVLTGDTIVGDLSIAQFRFPSFPDQRFFNVQRVTLPDPVHGGVLRQAIRFFVETTAIPEASTESMLAVLAVLVVLAVVWRRLRFRSGEPSSSG